MVDKKLDWYNPYQFSFFRIILGVYLAIHFSDMIPFAKELFSNQGMFPDPSLNPTYKVFPNLLSAVDSPLGSQLFLGALTLLSLLFAAGTKHRNLISLLLWYGWACLLNRNFFISNPGLAFVGWLLLACALIPQGEPLSLNKNRDEKFEMSSTLYWGAWFLMALGYTISGVHKLGAPSWRDGTALMHVLQIPLARDNFLREFLLTLPLPLLKSMTWGSVILEVLFLPLALWHRTRPLAWVGIVGMHFGILSVINFADLTIGVLMVHIFTFDPRWIKVGAFKTQPIVFFDGVCGLCNHTMNFIISQDEHKIYRYTPLQGETAKKELPHAMTENINSMAFKVGDRIYTQSEAVLRILIGLGGMWGFARIFLIIPGSLRNLIYSFVAKHRYRWFGKHETCRIPSPAERKVFLP